MSILTDFNPPFVPFSLVRDVFIDTGMADYAMIGDGCSLRNAVKQPFKELHGIEVSAANYRAACAWFGSNGQAERLTVCMEDDRELTFHCGSSPEVLPTILDPNKPTVIWCDSHYQGLPDRRDEMDPRYGECPLTSELRAILAVKWQVHPIIAIDDLNCFASNAWWFEHGRPFDRGQWPTFEAIYDLLEGWTLLAHDGILYCWKD